MDNKIQDGRRFKGKTAELSYYPHFNDYCGVKCCFRDQGIHQND
jgi:hypothetical protein